MKQFNQKLVIAAAVLLSTAVVPTHVQANGEALTQTNWISTLSTNASAKTVALSAAGCLTALGAIKLAKKVPGFLKDSLSWLKENQANIEAHVGIALIAAAGGILISSPMLFCDKEKLTEALLVSLSAYLLSMPFVLELTHDFTTWVSERDQLRRYGFILNYRR